ncbi:MAG: adenosine deaminase family protein [Opitutales bacterium]
MRIPKLPLFACRSPEAHGSSRRSFFKKGLMSTLALGGLAGTQRASAYTGPQGKPAGDAAYGPGVGKTGLSPFAREIADPDGFGELFETIKREATPEELYTVLYAMPKGGDIHHHLGGGMLPDMWYAIATDPRRNGDQIFYTRYRVSSEGGPLPFETGRHARGKIIQWITIGADEWAALKPQHKVQFKPLPDLTPEEQAAWKSSVMLDLEGEGRDEFFEYTWNRLHTLLGDLHVMSELLVENMKRFGAEGCRYMEIQTAPRGRMPDGSLVDADGYTTFFKNRLSQPDALATGVTVRFQFVVLRFAPDAEQQVENAFAYLNRERDLFVGINMAGREDNNKGYPERFKETYDKMLRKYPGIGISIHAGEAEKPDSHIFDTLRLGANRIGHGINLFSDEPTMQLMRAGFALIEINLVSNDLLGYVPDLNNHPFPIYLRQGIPCCLNTDDRGMWDSNFTDEYYAGVTYFNLSWAELTRMGRDSFRFSYARPALKAQLMETYESELAAFTKRFSRPDWRAGLQGVEPVTHGYGKNHLGLRL